MLRPVAVVTRRAARSMRTTFSPRRKRTRSSSTTVRSSSRSDAEAPANDEVRATRSYGWCSSSPMSVTRHVPSERPSRLAMKRWATIPAPTTTTCAVWGGVVLMLSP